LKGIALYVNRTGSMLCDLSLHRQRTKLKMRSIYHTLQATSVFLQSPGGPSPARAYGSLVAL
ncbi:hypothetical protein QUH41_16840, partial [Klebsiella grimontii]